MAFKHRISFATDLAANFGCNRFIIKPDIVSKPLCAAILSRCAVRFWQLLANAIENFISHEKKSDSSRPKIYKALNDFWLSNWVGIAKVIACFLQASRLLPTATVADSETPCVCARPSDPPKQCRRAAQRAWLLILPSLPSITFWNRLQRDCQMTGRGSNLDSNLNSAAWSTGCKGFICSEAPKCVEFEFFLSSLKTPKLRTSLRGYQPLSPRLQ